jgi:hypothetical protein
VGPRGVGKSALVNHCLHEFKVDQTVKNKLFKVLSVNGLTIRDPSKAMASLVQQFNNQQHKRKNEETVNITTQQDIDHKIESYHKNEKNDTSSIEILSSSFGSHSGIDIEDDIDITDDEIRIVDDHKETSIECELTRETNVLNSSESSIEIKIVEFSDSISTPHQRLNFSLTPSKPEHSDSDKTGTVTPLNQAISNQCKNGSFLTISQNLSIRRDDKIDALFTFDLCLLDSNFSQDEQEQICDKQSTLCINDENQNKHKKEKTDLHQNERTFSILRQNQTPFVHSSIFHQLIHFSVFFLQTGVCLYSSNIH